MPKSGFRDDPDWQSAQRRFVSDEYDTKDATRVFMQRILAAVEMWQIETRYEEGNLKP